jgi:hypothetical protein
MASMIKKTADPYFVKQTAKKEPSYTKFIHQLPCIITRRHFDVEGCHVSFPNRDYGHYGRARQSKAGDRWTLPMIKSLHDEQHTMDEAAFWRGQRINPHLACLIIWGLFTEFGDAAVDPATAIIMAGAF